MTSTVAAVCLLFLGAAEPPRVKGEPRLVRYNFPVWANATELDGGGAYIELLEKIYAAAGYESVREPAGDVPWKKAIRNVVLGASDTTGAEYEALIAQRGLIRPQCPLFFTTVVAVYRREAFVDGFSRAAVKEKRAVEILGYKLAEAVGLEVGQLDQANDEQSIGRMLLRRRVDVALLELYYFELAYESYPELRGEDFATVELGRHALFLMFANDDRGRQLAAAWDRGLRILARQGQLDEVRRIYEVHGLADGAPDFLQYLE